MAKSPGHTKWPDHQVREVQLRNRVLARLGDEVLADSHDVIRVDEDKQPARYYFPRADVKMHMLTPTDTTTKCPFKGTARYFTVATDQRRIEDAAWSYEDPYDEHLGIKGRLSFYADRFPEITVETQ